MIKYSYKKRGEYNEKPLRTAFCFLMFVDLTAFFFLSFMNICFEQIVSNPPTWLLTALFLIMGIDLVFQLYKSKRLTPQFILHFLIMLLLALSWIIDNNYVIYLSASVFLRFPQIIQFNQIMKVKLRPFPFLYKIYTMFKIFYVIIVVGHVLGCIFYAIDNNLIQKQYYGSINQNPTMYYQGSMLCYSPIYELDEIGRYGYCMYFIMSLLSTVAYGDIIPKNPFENAYVCVLLVLSTISIAFIIEQLLIVLSNNREQMFEILRKVKYLDSMLQKSTKISSSSRLTLIGYLMHSLKHDLNEPDIEQLTQNLQKRLITETIGLKQSNEEQQLYGMPRMYSYPLFLVEFLILKLKEQYYPVRYSIVDNENRHEVTRMFITLKGELKLGYGRQFLMRKNLKQKHKLLCWREFLFDNKQLHPHFRVQTRGLSTLYTIDSNTLKEIIKGQRVRSKLSDEKFSEILEKYFMARNKEFVSMYLELSELYQSSQSFKLLKQEAEGKEQEISETSTHILRCWACGKRTHFPDKCPNLHYKVNISQVLRNQVEVRMKRNNKVRRNIKSEKLILTRNNEFSEKHQIKESKKMLRIYIQRKNDQLKSLKRMYQAYTPESFQKYQEYQHFYHQYKVTAQSDVLY